MGLSRGAFLPLFLTLAVLTIPKFTAGAPLADVVLSASGDLNIKAEVTRDYLRLIKAADLENLDVRNSTVLMPSTLDLGKLIPGVTADQLLEDPKLAMAVTLLSVLPKTGNMGGQMGGFPSIVGKTVPSDLKNQSLKIDKCTTLLGTCNTYNVATIDDLKTKLSPVTGLNVRRMLRDMNVGEMVSTLPSPSMLALPPLTPPANLEDVLASKPDMSLAAQALQAVGGLSALLPEGMDPARFDGTLIMAPNPAWEKAAADLSTSIDELMANIPALTALLQFNVLPDTMMITGMLGTGVTLPIVPTQMGPLVTVCSGTCTIAPVVNFDTLPVSATITVADMLIGSGSMQIVDTLLMPPSLPDILTGPQPQPQPQPQPPQGSITDVLGNMPDVSAFLGMIKTADLVDALSAAGPVVMMVPTNQAIEDLMGKLSLSSLNLPDLMEVRPDVVAEMLKNAILPLTMPPRTGLKPGMTLRTITNDIMQTVKLGGDKLAFVSDNAVATVMEVVKVQDITMMVVDAVPSFPRVDKGDLPGGAPLMPGEPSEPRLEITPGAPDRPRLPVVPIEMTLPELPSVPGIQFEMPTMPTLPMLPTIEPSSILDMVVRRPELKPLASLLTIAELIPVISVPNLDVTAFLPDQATVAALLEMVRDPNSIMNDVAVLQACLQNLITRKKEPLATLKAKASVPSLFAQRPLFINGTGNGGISSNEILAGVEGAATAQITTKDLPAGSAFVNIITGLPVPDLKKGPYNNIPQALALLPDSDVTRNLMQATGTLLNLDPSATVSGLTAMIPKESAWNELVKKAGLKDAQELLRMPPAQLKNMMEYLVVKKQQRLTGLTTILPDLSTLQTQVDPTAVMSIVPDLMTGKTFIKDKFNKLSEAVNRDIPCGKTCLMNMLSSVPTSLPNLTDGTMAGSLLPADLELSPIRLTSSNTLVGLPTGPLSVPVVVGTPETVELVQAETESLRNMLLALQA